MVQITERIDLCYVIFKRCMNMFRIHMKRQRNRSNIIANILVETEITVCRLYHENGRLF